jgi:hypothetical protein
MRDVAFVDKLLGKDKSMEYLMTIKAIELTKNHYISVVNWWLVIPYVLVVASLAKIMISKKADFGEKFISGLMNIFTFIWHFPILMAVYKQESFATGFILATGIFIFFYCLGISFSALEKSWYPLSSRTPTTFREKIFGAWGCASGILGSIFLTLILSR